MLKKIDRFLDQHVHLCLLLLLLVVLRLPNFWEPYWYGDEAIYLTLGNALRAGERLYLEIIDHKTPLIYYLAMVPSQLWFRVLNVFCSVVSTILFYVLSRRIFQKASAASLSTLVFILLTTLPAFEGHIPNGELFVMFFVLIGGYLFSTTPLFTQFFNQKESSTSSKQHLFALVGAGVFFGLGILTKVPGLFDVMAFLSVGWFSLIRNLRFPFSPVKVWKQHSTTIFSTLVIVGGIVVPIVASVLYFIARGSGQAYLDYGLLYNFRYAGSWQPTLPIPALSIFFTLPVKALILAIWLAGVTLFHKYITPRFQFIAAWFGLALFATLLSNRPYPHYYLQVMPALALCVGHVFLSLSESLGKQKRFTRLLEGISAAAAVGVFLAILYLLNVGLYSTTKYYAQFAKFMTGQISLTQYHNSFDSLVADNYAAARIITSSKNPYLLIWGTNPMLYAQTGKLPPGRFTVLFHVKDFKAENETIADFVEKAPEYVVTMKNEQVPPELANILYHSYLPNMDFERFTLWKKYDAEVL